MTKTAYRNGEKLSPPAAVTLPLWHSSARLAYPQICGERPLQTGHATFNPVRHRRARSECCRHLDFHQRVDEHEALQLSAPPTSVSSSVQQVSQKIARVGFERLGDIDEFDDVEPPLTSLVLCNEGLRTLEPAGDLRLRQPACLPHPSEEVLEAFLAR